MRIWMVLVLLIACGKSKDEPKGDKPAASKGDKPGGWVPMEFTNRPKEACPLMPKDLVLRFAPEAKPPIEEKLGSVSCVMGAPKGGIQITFDTGPYPSPGPVAKAISGIGGGGSVERLDSTSPGDVYLSISLGDNYNLRVEVTVHDGKDHEEDALAIARAVIGQLR